MNAADFRLIAPPPTPFHDDLTLNLEPLGPLAKWLKESGVCGVFVSGSTGEGQSLTNQERMDLAAAWMDVARSYNLEVIVQVGHNAQGDAIQLARHAQEIGADAVAAAAPCYFKPRRVDDLIDFMEPVASACGDLPFYYYDIPGLSGVQLAMARFLEQGKPRMPNLVGLKYSNPDLMQMQECVQLNDSEFEILFGSDQTLAAGILLGAVGAVGTTYNMAAPLYVALVEALAAGDVERTRELQAHSEYFIRRVLAHGDIAAFKALMQLRGIHCGPVRPPLKNLSPTEQTSLLNEMGHTEAMSFPLPSCSRDASGTEAAAD